MGVGCLFLRSQREEGKAGCMCRCILDMSLWVQEVEGVHTQGTHIFPVP